MIAGSATLVYLTIKAEGAKEEADPTAVTRRRRPSSGDSAAEEKAPGGEVAERGRAGPEAEGGETAPPRAGRAAAVPAPAPRAGSGTGRPASRVPVLKVPESTSSRTRLGWSDYFTRCAL